MINAINIPLYKSPKILILSSLDKMFPLPVESFEYACWYVVSKQLFIFMLNFLEPSSSTEDHIFQC